MWELCKLSPGLYNRKILKNPELHYDKMIVSSALFLGICFIIQRNKPFQRDCRTAFLQPVTNGVQVHAGAHRGEEDHISRGKRMFWQNTFSHHIE